MEVGLKFKVFLLELEDLLLVLNFLILELHFEGFGLVQLGQYVLLLQFEDLLLLHQLVDFANLPLVHLLEFCQLVLELFVLLLHLIQNFVHFAHYVLQFLFLVLRLGTRLLVCEPAFQVVKHGLVHQRSAQSRLPPRSHRFRVQVHHLLARKLQGFLQSFVFLHQGVHEVLVLAVLDDILVTPNRLLLLLSLQLKLFS